MAKEKDSKTPPAPVSERTFICKFCGQAKPLSELTLQKQYFPVLTACRECDKTLQSLKMGDELLEEDGLTEEEMTENTENEQAENGSLNT